MPNTKIQAARQFFVASDVSFESTNGTNGNQLQGLKNPSSDFDAANKFYVDSVASGLDIKNSCRVATIGSETMTVVSGAVTQINGLTVDGVTLAVNDRILIKNAPATTGAASATNSNQPANGIYRVTANTTNLTVTRDTDADSNAEVTSGLFTFITAGTTNTALGFVLITQGSITLNSTALQFTQFSAATQITAGAGLGQTGNAFDVNVVTNRTAITGDAVDISANYVGQGSITTVGTITSGTWNGGVIDVQRGGSGRNSATVHMPICGGTGSTTAHQSVAASGTAGQALIYQGAAAIPAWAALNLSVSTSVTGVLAGVNGGTGQSSYTQGDILYAATTGNTLSKLTIGAAGTVLKGGSNPSWGAVSLTADVSGTLPIANGGTGLNTTPTNGQLLIGNTATNSYVRATLTSTDGSVTITNGNGSIDLTVSSGTSLTAAKFIFNETPTGTVDGTNTVFTLAQAPVTGKVMVFVNGVLQKGASNDYSIAGSTITFLSGSIPATGDFVTTTYIAA